MATTRRATALQATTKMMIATSEDEDDDNGDGATGDKVDNDSDGATGDGATGYDDNGKGATGDDDDNEDNGDGTERRNNQIEATASAGGNNSHWDVDDHDDTDAAAFAGREATYTRRGRRCG